MTPYLACPFCSGVGSDIICDVSRLRSSVLANIALSSSLIFAQPGIDRPLSGLVVDEGGMGVGNALVVASGAGFNGWATTDETGSFHVRAAGAFVSVRHVGFKPQLLSVAALVEPVRIRLEKAESAKEMPVCSSMPGNGRAWIGGGLKVNPGGSHVEGPQFGEHDSHWYVKIGKDTLHIVDGYAWHAGLPLESVLTASQETSISSWESGDIVGLDLSGVTKEGKRWRWLGAPLADAIEYSDAAPESADAFDGIIRSVCFGSTSPNAK